MKLSRQPKRTMMDPILDTPQCDTLRAVLLARRESLLGGLALRQGGVSRAQHARDVLLQDADDAVAHGAEREIDLALTDHERQELAEIGAALQRLDAGEYGQCLDCGAEIGFDRLCALPQAQRCVPCESVREARAGKVRHATM